VRIIGAAVKMSAVMHCEFVALFKNKGIHPSDKREIRKPCQWHIEIDVVTTYFYAEFFDH